MNPPLSYTFHTFGELSVDALYEILQLRQEIFIVEQNCPYNDADGKDLSAVHVSGRLPQGQLITYARILPPNISYPGFSSIGRVICHRDFRRFGYGISLMQTTIKHTEELFPNHSIKIGAQAYLKAFYMSFGFIDLNEPYLEDGIPHLIMVKE
ncbi:MAG: GNAT family N-acetyltransferase [Chitinophagales bacterium]|nr:GNAT family N-acetyltransferase [Chitinophagales bacterium]